MAINNFQTIIGLLNGMIGGSILVLPLQGIIVGYLGVTFITVFLTLISGYTAYLILKHLGQAKTINESIEAHFSGNTLYSKIYNIYISTTFFPWVFAYYRLLVLQLKGLFNISESNWILPLCIFLIIVLLTIFLKKYQLGEKLLAYGIISIIGYLIFLTWAQITSPGGQNHVTPFGSGGGYSNYSAILMGALAVHDFLVQVMIHNPQRKSYSKIALITYTIGGMVYLYIGYGSFAIINRTAIKQDPQIISDYFQYGQWQVHLIQILYAIHLFTAAPEFTLISKVRMFQAFGIQQQKGLQIKQVLYIVGVFSMAFLFYILKIKISTILQISGSLMALFYVIIIPVVIHLKCLYYDQSCGFIQGQDQHNKKIQENQNSCLCDIKYRSKAVIYLETVWIGVTVLTGVYVTFYTLYSLAFGK